MPERVKNPLSGALLHEGVGPGDRARGSPAGSLCATSAASGSVPNVLPGRVKGDGDKTDGAQLARPRAGERTVARGAHGERVGIEPVGADSASALFAQQRP